jgi:hypothetical protein
VRERWLSRRAVFLHIGCLLFVPFCVAATWWQITRAEDGNGLSYLYTFEWPVFAILGVYFWWQFLHTDYDAVGLRGMRNQAAAELASTTDPSAESAPVAVAVAVAVAEAEALSPTRAVPAASAGLGPGEVDPELAAYNARLAALASSGEKTWRKPETHVARRPQ